MAKGVYAGIAITMPDEAAMLTVDQQKDWQIKEYGQRIIPGLYWLHGLNIEQRKTTFRLT